MPQNIYLESCRHGSNLKSGKASGKKIVMKVDGSLLNSPFTAGNNRLETLYNVRSKWGFHFRKMTDFSTKEYSGDFLYLLYCSKPIGHSAGRIFEEYDG